MPRSAIAVEATVQSGPLSTVYRGRWRGCSVALKALRGDSQQRVQEALAAELSVLEALRHPRVLTLMGVCRDLPAAEGLVGLVTEFMAWGSLHDLLHDESAAARSRRPRDVQRRLQLGLDVAEGMAFLHRSGVLHRDLKSANILLGDDGRAKIADFGLSSFRATCASHATGLIGTVAWTAPEIFLGGAFRQECDVYSFGVVLWEVVTGDEPWAGKQHFQIMNLVGNLGRGLPVPQSSDLFPGPLRDLLVRSLGPADRRQGFDLVAEQLRALLVSRSTGDAPLCYVCPITLAVMEDPVICSDGHTYERAAIDLWLRNFSRSPKTNAELPPQSLIPNFALRDAIALYKQTHV